MRGTMLVVANSLERKDNFGTGTYSKGEVVEIDKQGNKLETNKEKKEEQV